VCQHRAAPRANARVALLYRHVSPGLIAPTTGRRGAFGLHLRWRQRLADRLWSELGEDRPQGADTLREWVAVALNDIVKLLGKSGGFVVC
jgi:hypothetical protein